MKDWTSQSSIFLSASSWKCQTLWDGKFKIWILAWAGLGRFDMALLYRWTPRSQYNRRIPGRKVSLACRHAICHIQIWKLPDRFWNLLFRSSALLPQCQSDHRSCQQNVSTAAGMANEHSSLSRACWLKFYALHLSWAKQLELFHFELELIRKHKACTRGTEDPEDSKFEGRRKPSTQEVFTLKYIGKESVTWLYVGLLCIAWTWKNA